MINNLMELLKVLNKTVLTKKRRCVKLECSEESGNNGEEGQFN
jgi:hypothetical protein